MSKILVSGTINIETTLRVDGFPIPYFPVRYPFWGVRSTVSGVGYNVAKALKTLGDEVRFLSIIGRDMQGTLVREALTADGIPQNFIRTDLNETPQSVILYDDTGRRQINVDLKDLQECDYPTSQFEAALDGCMLAALCNINFSRPLLKIAQQRGVTIATDVHALSNLDDDYNRDFMQAADILFMSDEHLPTSPEDWAQKVLDRYQPNIVVIGLGAQGALLALREPREMTRLPAIYTRPVINSIGAGDALFSAFVHFYAQQRNAYTALQRAMVFASYKIGEKGAAEGFLTEGKLEQWYRDMKRET